MSYLYYPGCSLKSTGKAYEESILPVFRALGEPMAELDDWNCCGATAYMAIDELKAYAVATRNLALAEQQDPDKQTDLVAPCNACYLCLNKAVHYMDEQAKNGRKISKALDAAGLSYEGRVTIRHPLDVIVNDIGLERVKERVQKPLDGMKVACYYGCQIVRPYATFDDQYNPMSMDRLMEAVGAEPLIWPLKTRCCGGSLTGTVENVGLRLSYILLKEAKKRGADAVATCCPLCQFNLECYQDRMLSEYGETMDMPVVYFSQLAGLALGIPENELGMQRLFVPLRTAEPVH